MADRIQDIEIALPLHNHAAISSEDIAKQVREFKKRGNKIVRIKRGVTGIDQKESKQYSKAASVKRMSSRRIPIVGINVETGERIEFGAVGDVDAKGFSNNQVSRCLNGTNKSMTDVHRGYRWRYA